MPCFHPISAWKPNPAKTKSTRIFFKWSPVAGEPIEVPCGRCLGCRMSKAQDWQTRLQHEASQHNASSFLTLTYNDAELPADYGLCVRDLQLFMKRLRKWWDHPIRFFACGEYGDTGLRPHYHALVFGLEFGDLVPWRKTPTGYITYRSAQLEKLWTQGHAEVGTVTSESAGYVARYCLKKVNGDAADDHYTRAHPFTGEINRVKPEFIVMSRRPGIGATWLEKYAGDAFPSDFVVLDGTRKPVPAYYLRKQAEDYQQDLKAKRKEKALAHADDNTPDRLATKEEVLRLRVLNLKRELE